MLHRVVAVAIFATVAVSNPAAADGSPTLYQRYQAAKTAKELIEVEIEGEWVSFGADRSKSPKAFACVVDVSMGSFKPEEIAAIEAFAADRSVANKHKMEAAVHARNERFDVDSEALKKCEKLKGT